MIKFETHLHTGNTSYCALYPAEKIAELYRKVGYGGIIVTDHYMQYVLDRGGETSFTKKIDNLLKGYRTVKKEGDKLGMKVFLGIEINLEQYNEENMPSQEYLIYGSALEEMLYSHPYINKYTQVELFDVCNECNLTMFQAHPFRTYCVRGQAEFMHGVEIFNANPRHDSNNGLAKSFAKQHNLLRISGGDFHQLGDEGRGGLLVPDEVKTLDELMTKLKNRETELFIGD